MEMTVRSGTLKESISSAVKQGLTARQKKLPSWLFYDARGDELFREIMTLPEYYLTMSETQILKLYSDAIAYNFKSVSSQWDIIELGAGDGTKTKLLLSAFQSNNIKVRYFPVDISKDSLEVLDQNMKAALPELEVNPLHADFLSGLSDFKKISDKPKLVLFLGANIGNFEVSEASVFMRSVSSMLSQRDFMIVGFDMMKVPSIIEKAYHDYRGVTTLFNKNVLIRLNRELGANFNVGNFEHWPIYDPVSGSCRSYLVSTISQEVVFKSIAMTVKFKPWETIHMEVSQKYSEEMLNNLVSISGFQVDKLLFDERRFFSLALMKIVT